MDLSLNSSKQFSKVILMFPVPFSRTTAVTLVLPETLKERLPPQSLKKSQWHFCHLSSKKRNNSSFGPEIWKCNIKYNFCACKKPDCNTLSSGILFFHHCKTTMQFYEIQTKNLWSSWQSLTVLLAYKRYNTSMISSLLSDRLHCVSNHWGFSISHVHHLNYLFVVTWMKCFCTCPAQGRTC